MPHASLVIGHGGHGTTARALSYGLPLIVMPMHPLMDQPAIGRAIARSGAGRMLAKSAKPRTIRAAVVELLADGPHRAAAARLGNSIRERDGADVAADLLDAFIAQREGGNPTINVE
jgi:UDP:flavonoid glycosyltransferase YjiC (YdhE family)